MAKIIQPKTTNELNKLPVSKVRRAYESLANCYKKIINRNILLCPKCGDFLLESGFYQSEEYVTDRFPICKRCLKAMVEQRDNELDEPNETKESVQRVLQMMNKIYDNSYYEHCVKAWEEGTQEIERKSPFSIYIAGVQSLPQFRGKTWAHSTFGAEGSIVKITNKKPKSKTRKIFGVGYTDEEYLYLEEQFEDWCERTQVDTKSQETYIVQICLLLLDIDRDRKRGKDVSKKLKALDDLMGSAKLQPKQNVGNASTDGLTFGQLIEKWENEDPIPEPDDEFKDVDNIGKYLKTWFGWLAKALGLSNAYTKEYEEEIKKYTVEKPDFNDENSSTAVYDSLFGGDKGE